MEKIKMVTPIVEMDGDEMTRIIWSLIKEQLIEPYVELKSEYYDLGLPNRDLTKDQVTIDAALATKKYGVAVKCATITPNKDRVKEYNLTGLWKSPNATIRASLDGTVFREPILIDCVKPAVRFWNKPITIARHAYGDIYKAVEIKTETAGKCELVFTDVNGNVKKEEVFTNKGPAIFQGMHNKISSIESFAHATFKYGLETKQDVWFSAKDTISKTYDGTFRDVVNDVFEKYYAADFKKLGLQYFYTLIDDAVARVIRSNGGFIWACKNYDGDVMSDMVSTAFGSLSMMKSVLVSPDGCFEYEAAHGTVTRHYYRYLKGEETSTNPIATILAWSGGLNKRGQLDNTNDLCLFAKNLENSIFKVLDKGYMTKDLANLAKENRSDITELNTKEFISKIKEELDLIY